MSLPTLIDMFIRNTQRALHYWYKKLKRQELIWEQFLTEVTVIDDEEAKWDSSKRKEDDKDKKVRPQVTRGQKPARRRPEMVYLSVLKSSARN